MKNALSKLAPWAFLTIALVSLRVLGFVIDGDAAEQRHQRCDALRGAPEAKVDETFGMPQRTLKSSQLQCPEGRNCSQREYAFGVDWSLVAHFEDGVLNSCDISDS